MRCAFYLLLGITSPAFAASTVHITHYDISGQTRSALVASMEKVAPSYIEGGFYGYTHYDIHWHYNYAWQGGLCRLTNITTSIDSKITMPQLNPHETFSADTEAAFTRYSANLTTHEMGHVQIGIDATTEIERAFAGLPGDANCDALGAKANQLGETILAKAKEKNILYDATTRHGMTQGATLQ